MHYIYYILSYRIMMSITGMKRVIYTSKVNLFSSNILLVSYTLPNYQHILLCFLVMFSSSMVLYLISFNVSESVVALSM